LDGYNVASPDLFGFLVPVDDSVVPEIAQVVSCTPNKAEQVMKLIAVFELVPLKIIDDEVVLERKNVYYTFDE
jgi:hypothetical protein